MQQLLTTPVVQAILLADHVYQDRSTGKFVIAGTFNHLFSRRFPMQMERSAWAYICLTNIQGKAQIEFRYVDLSNYAVLMDAPPLPIEQSDRLATVQLAVHVPPLPMPHEGDFAFEIYANGELVGSWRIRVDLMTGAA